MKVGAIQINSLNDKRANIRTIESIVDDCVEFDAPDMIVLPEVAPFMSPDLNEVRAMAEPIDGPFAQAMARLAARSNCVLHAGSMIEAHGGRFYNTSLVFDRSGALIGTYRKMHRYDATLPDGTRFGESELVDRGDEVVVVPVDGHKVGLAICYDVRFSRLFDELARLGCSIIALPAAFTFQTGADHWEILVRARAIETQCYIVAPGQIGTYGGGKHMNFGHTMIVDPWGTVIGQVSNREGWVTSKLDLGYLNAVRSLMPVREHKVLG